MFVVVPAASAQRPRLEPGDAVELRHETGGRPAWAFACVAERDFRAALVAASRGDQPAIEELVERRRVVRVRPGTAATLIARSVIGWTDADGTDRAEPVWLATLFSGTPREAAYLVGERVCVKPPGK